MYTGLHQFLIAFLYFGNVFAKCLHIDRSGVCAEYESVSFRLVSLTALFCQGKQFLRTSTGNLFRRAKRRICCRQETVMSVKRQLCADNRVLRFDRIPCHLYKDFIALTENLRIGLLFRVDRRLQITKWQITFLTICNPDKCRLNIGNDPFNKTDINMIKQCLIFRLKQLYIKQFPLRTHHQIGSIFFLVVLDRSNYQAVHFK